jgi:hypothetical protein
MSGQVGWGTTIGMDPSLLEALGWKEYIEIASQPYPAHVLEEVRAQMLTKADTEQAGERTKKETRA